VTLSFTVRIEPKYQVDLLDRTGEIYPRKRLINFNEQILGRKIQHTIFTNTKIFYFGLLIQQK
jgi:hypothetical protein